MGLARVRREQGGFLPRVGQRHVDDVDRKQVNLARIEAAFENGQVGDLRGLDAERCGRQAGQGVQWMRRGLPVDLGFGRGVCGAAVFGWHCGQWQFEFGESDHVSWGLC
jgi:hypothetical protein